MNMCCNSAAAVLQQSSYRKLAKRVSGEIVSENKKEVGYN